MPTDWGRALATVIGLIFSLLVFLLVRLWMSVPTEKWVVVADALLLGNIVLYRILKKPWLSRARKCTPPSTFTSITRQARER